MAVYFIITNNVNRKYLLGNFKNNVAFILSKQMFIKI